MRRSFKKFCALVLVALITDFGLSLFRQHRVLRCVNLVTAGTYDIAILVHTALPVDVIGVFMAIEAHAILLFCRLIGLGTEI